MTNPFRHLATIHALARNLDRASLLICLRVCRAWYRVLEPLLWHDFWLLRNNIPADYLVVLQRNRHSVTHNDVRQGLFKEASGRRLYPSPASIQKNAQHIRRLFYYGEEHLFKQLAPFCTQLRYLETARYGPEMKPLLLQNLDTLQTFICKTDPVKVAGAEPVFMEWIWKYLAEMKVLRIVELDSVILSDYEGSKFGIVCRKLTRLSLVDSKLIERPKSETEDFMNLKSLVLDQSYIPNLGQLELFQLCPVMESLTWKSRTGALPIANFLVYLSSDKSPAAHLAKLDLSTSKITDEDFVQIIQLLPQLTHLQAAKTLFGSAATQALLQGQSHQMQMINLLDCPDVTKVETQALLQGCSALKVFYAPVVSAVGMLGNKWACTALEELDVSIADIDQLPAPSFPRHRAVYSQLSELVHLRVLRLGDCGFTPMPDPRAPAAAPNSGSPQLKYVLDMRLDSGLGLLSTLTQLRELDLENMHAAMEFGTLQWMAQNWRGLRLLVGCVHPLEQQRNLSNDFLREFIPGLKTFLSRKELQMWRELQ
ncbi:hypothetical protein CPC16_010579 [Podila verticillata]|nr:hypothetical protein BGZ59_009605 [Podila verticillata]KAF9379821.1 hypothetical protein CPC16_010579 [Podila verticillata]KAI9231074.1 MAG: hypothetical protein BYD32DRAFT_431659 [Podila humilis]